MSELLPAEPIIVKPARAATVSRITTAIAIVAVTVAVSLIVLVVGGDRDGWKQLAVDTQAENQLLKTALFCRSDAAQVESAALGEVVIEVGSTAEAALRSAIEPLTRESILDLAGRLATTSEALRAATIERAATNERCAVNLNEDLQTEEAP